MLVSSHSGSQLESPHPWTRGGSVASTFFPAGWLDLTGLQRIPCQTPIHSRMLRSSSRAAAPQRRPGPATFSLMLLGNLSCVVDFQEELRNSTVLHVVLPLGRCAALWVPAFNFTGCPVSQLSGTEAMQTPFVSAPEKAFSDFPGNFLRDIPPIKVCLSLSVLIQQQEVLPTALLGGSGPPLSLPCPATGTSPGSDTLRPAGTTRTWRRWCVPRGTTSPSTSCPRRTSRRRTCR